MVGVSSAFGISAVARRQPLQLNRLAILISLSGGRTLGHVKAGPAMPRSKFLPPYPGAPACPPKLDKRHPHLTFLGAWQRLGAPALCGRGSWVVNIGAAWQGDSSKDSSGRQVVVKGQDFAWNVVAWASQHPENCSHVPHIVAWEADPKRLEGLHSVKAKYWPGSSKVVLRGGWATPESIAAAPELEPPSPSARRPHLLKVDIDSMDLPVVNACLRRFRPYLLVVEINNFTPLPMEFAALTAAYAPPSMASTPAPRFGLGYKGGNAKWPCMGASLGYWVRWLARRHGYRLVTTDHENNAMFIPTDEAGTFPRGEGGGRRDAHANDAYSDTQMYCHGAMTIADLYRLRLCKRSDRGCLFRSRLQFPPYVPRPSEVARYGALLGTTDAHKMPSGLRPAIQSIYRTCDVAQVPFSLVINGTCCPGAQASQRGNGSFCRCTIGELGMSLDGNSR